MEGQSMRAESEEQLVSALRNVSIQREPREETPSMQVAVSKKEGYKTVIRLLDKGIFTFYYQGEPALGPFRSWANANWGRRLNIQIDSVQEAGDRAIITMLRSTEDRDKVLKMPHQPIRGCLVAHFAWEPEIDDDNYKPLLTPDWIQICKVPKWAREDIPKIFTRFGQVLSIPQDSRELANRDAMALVLREETVPLPEAITVSLGERRVDCKVREKGEGDCTKDPKTYIDLSVTGFREEERTQPGGQLNPRRHFDFGNGLTPQPNITGHLTKEITFETPAWLLAATNSEGSNSSSSVRHDGSLEVQSVSSRGRQLRCNKSTRRTKARSVAPGRRKVREQGDNTRLALLPNSSPCLDTGTPGRGREERLVDIPDSAYNKKRRFSEGEREINSEPLIDLNEMAPGGLRTSRSG
ncbi:hypothetical protein R1sor_001377 [Riccia sorocarpa]|uniref:DUF4283 domain-containing protein n=1 Tax=Riccia sorocarpa TaxID=122646 RepID=A0ABD3GVT2_9MARC